MNDETVGSRPTVSGQEDLYPRDHRILEKKDPQDLKGKSLEVYYYLAENTGEHGVREIQRKMDYNSPSIAAYHLNRLYEYNLVEKTDDGKYFIEGDPVRLGALKDHVKIAGSLVPRTIIYGIQAVFSIVFAIIFLITDADSLLWFIFFVLINLLVIVRVVQDSLEITGNLSTGNET